jgi:hypothetical protein
MHCPVCCRNFDFVIVFGFIFFFFDIVASNITVVKEVEAIMDPAAFTVVRFVVSAIPFLLFALQA